MKVINYFFVGISIMIFAACQSNNSPIDDTNSSVKSNSWDSIRIIQGLINITSSNYIAREVKQKKEAADKAAFYDTIKREMNKINLPNRYDKFPACDYTKVIFYELLPSHHIEGVFTRRTGNLKDLNQKDIDQLINIIANPQSYTLTTDACHDARAGVVFYNANNEPCSYTSICLACNNIYFAPEMDFYQKVRQTGKFGFSPKSRKKLRKLFESWGFPDNNMSFHFDDEETYIKIMQRQGWEEEKINKEIEYYRENFSSMRMY